MNGYVCITGTSSGLGRNAVGHLIQAGYHVIATVRKEKDRSDLQNEYQEGLTVVLCDVTSDEDVETLKGTVSALCGNDGLTALINNAGIVESGPLLYLETSRLLHQMEVNLLGVHRTTRALYDFLRLAQRPIIINMGSVSGIVSFPFTGAYACSKFALEAWNDALRRELAPLGIRVVLLQPAAVRTPIWSKSQKTIQAFDETPYGDVLKKSEYIIEKNSTESMDPNIISRLMVKVIGERNPKTRYLIAPKKWIFKLLKWLPDRRVDRILYQKMFQLKGKDLMKENAD